jgi:hypothetical protein
VKIREISLESEMGLQAHSELLMYEKKELSADERSIWLVLEIDRRIGPLSVQASMSRAPAHWLLNPLSKPIKLLSCSADSSKHI